MLQPLSILKFLFLNHEVLHKEETTNMFELKARCSLPLPAIDKACLEYVNQLPGDDQLQLTISENEEPFTFQSSEQSKWQIFFDSWDHFQTRADSEDEVEVIIIILKQTYDQNCLHVYDSFSFFSHLERLTATEYIQIFSRLFNNNGSCIYFIVPDIKEEFHTETVFFISNITRKSHIQTPLIDRSKRWGQIQSISYFSGIIDCKTLPEDFNIVVSGEFSNNIRQRFDQCCLLLCLSVIYDTATIQDNTLFIKLNGYKTFNKSLTIDDLVTGNLPVYYKIYKWILSGGNVQDKIGLARNLISLNLSPSDNYSVAQSVYNSILSGYKVYERQNIKQYIELRNKMSDQVIGFNERASKIVDGFASGFQKSALAVVSLYASIIVSRVLSTHNFIQVFTLDSAVLSFAFLTISAIYFFINRWEINVQKRRFIESYNNMKKRNEDLLTPEDIAKILNNDIEFNGDVTFINDKKLRYSLLWISMLVIFSVVTLVLSFVTKTK